MLFCQITRKSSRLSLQFRHILQSTAAHNFRHHAATLIFPLILNFPPVIQSSLYCTVILPYILLVFTRTCHENRIIFRCSNVHSVRAAAMMKASLIITTQKKMKSKNFKMRDDSHYFQLPYSLVLPIKFSRQTEIIFTLNSVIFKDVLQKYALHIIESENDSE
jgi:hypothetical protein